MSQRDGVYYLLIAEKSFSLISALGLFITDDRPITVLKQATAAMMDQVKCHRTAGQKSAHRVPINSQIVNTLPSSPRVKGSHTPNPETTRGSNNNMFLVVLNPSKSNHPPRVA